MTLQTGKLKEQIFKILDSYKNALHVGDLRWKNILNRTDIRNWKSDKIIKQPDGTSAVQFHVEENDDIKKYHDEIDKKHSPFIKAITIQQWTNNLLEGKNVSNKTFVK